jgi:hypothetical protein
MVRDIIQSNHWERPIHFAVTCAPDSKIGLDPYLWMEGLTLELRPMSFATQEGGNDMKMMEANFLARDVKASKTEQHGYLYRNLNNPDVYYDENVQRMVMNYRAGFMRISDYYNRTANDKRKARDVMARMEDVVPISVIPMQDWRYTFYVARLFNDLGEKDRFDAYAKNVEAKCEELIASGQYDQSDGSSNPYLILSELYGMRKEYPKAIDMLNNLAVQYPDQTGWIKNQINMYDKLQKGGAAPDSTRPQ